LVGGAIALCGAASYSKLASDIAESGGEYVFLTRRMHPAAGFVAGWVSLLAGFTGAAAFAAVAFETYASHWLPSLPPTVLASTLTIAATLAHAFRPANGLVGQNLLVAVKLTLLVGFIIVAYRAFPVWALDGGAASYDGLNSFPILSFATTVMWVSLSYSGFNAAVYVTEESRSGVGRATMVATTVVTLLYLALNAAFVLAPPFAEVAGRPDVAAVAASWIGGDRLGGLVRIAICLALASSVSSSLVAGPRVYAKMAMDGRLPSLRLNAGNSPTTAVLAQGLAVLVAIQIAGLRELLSYLGLTLTLCSATAVSVLLLPNARSSLTAKLLAVSFILPTLCFAGLMAAQRPAEVMAVAITVVSGLVIYVATKRWQNT
jgi:APA family basic amino acid/polyamine antiporter